MPSYKIIDKDGDKARIYNHRVKLSEKKNEGWQAQVKREMRRFEAISMASQQTADGHAISGSTPVVIGVVDAIYSAMTAVEVDVLLTPKGQGTDDQAYVASAAMGQEWDESSVNREAAYAIKDAILSRIGWVKVGYEYYEEAQEVPRVDEERQAEILRLVREAEQAGDENGPSPDEIDAQVPLTELIDTVISDRIVVDHVQWDMMLFDPEAKRAEDLTWVGQKTYMHPEEIKSNPAFLEYCKSRKTTKKLEKIKADSVLSKELLGEYGDPTPDDQRTTLYTICDLMTGTVCSFTKDADFLLNETPSPFALNHDPIDRSPWLPLILRKTPERLPGISELDVMSSTAGEMDLYHSRLGTYLERMAPKFVAKPRTFSEAGKTALRSRVYGMVAELEEGADMDWFTTIDPPRLMSEMFAMPDRLTESMREATGANELMRGLFPDRKRTATETTEVVAASAARQAEKRMALENFLKGIAHRMLQLMQMYYEKERVVKLADDAGDVDWSWSAEDIAGSFNLDIALTPKEDKSWQSRRDNATTVLNILGPLMTTPQPDGSFLVHPGPLLKYVLTEMNFPRRVIQEILVLPEEKQAQVLGQLQNSQQQAQAAAGGAISPVAVPGPLGAPALAAAANLGQIPPEILAAASGIGPGAPQGAEAVSESRGVA